MSSFYRDPGNARVTRRHFGRYQVANPPLVSNASASTDESWTAKSAHVILPEEPSDPPALWNTLELIKWKVGRFSLIYIEFNLIFNLIFNLLSETGFTFTYISLDGMNAPHFIFVGGKFTILQRKPTIWLDTGNFWLKNMADIRQVSFNERQLNQVAEQMGNDGTDNGELTAGCHDDAHSGLFTSFPLLIGKFFNEIDWKNSNSGSFSLQIFVSLRSV